jgi:cytochrome P450
VERFRNGALCEALRLYPPVPLEHKSSLKPDVLPSGHKIKSNTMILNSLYSIGRVEEIWGEDCLEFKPERWISKEGGIIHVPSYKFIAFNDGPRSCLGKDISFIEMKIIAATILLNYHIKVVESHPICFYSPTHETWLESYGEKEKHLMIKVRSIKNNLTMFISYM